MSARRDPRCGDGALCSTSDSRRGHGGLCGCHSCCRGRRACTDAAELPGAGRPAGPSAAVCAASASPPPVASLACPARAASARLRVGRRGRAAAGRAATDEARRQPQDRTAALTPRLGRAGGSGGGGRCHRPPIGRRDSGGGSGSDSDRSGPSQLKPLLGVSKCRRLNDRQVVVPFSIGTRAHHTPRDGRLPQHAAPAGNLETEHTRRAPRSRVRALARTRTHATLWYRAVKRGRTDRGVEPLLTALTPLASPCVAGASH